MTSLLSTLDPDRVARLPEAERAAIWRMIELEHLLASPATFATQSSHGLWQPYRHLVHTSERIVAMIERDACDCLIVEEPVRHGKSELCSRWTPAWYVLRYGGRVGLSSYEADFAASHGRRAREIVGEHGPALGIEIDNTSKAAARWDVVGGRGGMWTAGAGGPITGKGADLLVLDDPIKNAEEANSDLIRDHLWEWWNTTFLTRRDTAKTKVIVIMSRWHADDLVARLLRHKGGMRVERIRLPAVAEDDDPIGRHPGEALCPERFDDHELAGIRADIGPGPWAALYQQRPMLAGGGMFKRNSFRFYTQIVGADTTYNQLGEKLVDDADCWRFATMDPAYSSRRRSDFTALCVWAVTPTDPPSLMLLDVRRVRVESTHHAPMVEDAWAQWQPAWIGIEKQAASMSLLIEAQRRGVVVRELRPDRNKIARAETAAALMDAGRIWFPESAPWLPEFQDELLTFPVGAHDDQVDCLSYAGIELAAARVRARRRHIEPGTLEERHWKMIHDRERHAHRHPVLGSI